jgi:hypothetical protein
LISILVAAAIQSPAVVEWLDPTWGVVSIQAVVKLPQLSQKEYSLLAQVVGTLGSETSTYSGTQIADIAVRAGSRMRASLMPDHVRVGMEVVAADASTGIGMVGAVLRESVVNETKLSAVAQDFQFRRQNFWRQATDSLRFQPEKYLAEDITELMERVFRPENVTLAVGGKITPGVATQRWEDIRAAWSMKRLPPVRTAAVITPSAAKLDSNVAVLDFQGDEFIGGDAALATRLLALTAIGTGKAASLWKVSRESLGASYRQEAILVPTNSGFRPRLLLAHEGSEDLADLGEKIREGLLAEINLWTDEDRKRALGMAESYLVRGGDMSPLYLAPGRSLDGDLADQTFLQAYWLMKTGTRWNPHQLVGKMGFVELPDLKSTAQKIVLESRLVIHKARS